MAAAVTAVSAAQFLGPVNRHHDSNFDFPARIPRVYSDYRHPVVVDPTSAPGRAAISRSSRGTFGQLAERPKPPRPVMNGAPRVVTLRRGDPWAHLDTGP